GSALRRKVLIAPLADASSPHVSLIPLLHIARENGLFTPSRSEHPSDAKNTTVSRALVWLSPKNSTESERIPLMKYLSRSMIAVSALAMMAVAAEAKTFVYCSEASPEGFDPAPY